MSGLSQGTRLPDLKFVSLAVLELLAFNQVWIQDSVVQDQDPDRQDKDSNAQNQDESQGQIKHDSNNMTSVYCNVKCLGNTLHTVMHFIQCQTLT